MNKFRLLLLLTLVLAFAGTRVAQSQAPCGCLIDCVLYGDVNNDGEVNVSDLMYLANYLAGNVQLDSVQMKAANVFKDGVIDITDLFVLANFLAGNVQLPVTPP